MNYLFSLLVRLTLVSFVLASCSLPLRRVERPSWLTRLEEVHGKLFPGEIIEVDDQRSITFENLLDRLEDKRIVYVGETHDDMDHHEVQLKILRGLYARDPQLVIGMEMFQRSFQSVLDAWSDGTMDRKTLLRQSEWFSRWKFDFSLYEEILVFARENKIKIMALNAPRELVRKVGDFGEQALSPGEKAMIAPIDTSDTLHRAYIQKVFNTHHKTPGQTFQKFYEAQCVWDDTMAETISDFVATGEGENSRVIVFSGVGHIVYKFGIPMRAFRRTGVPYATIIPSNLKGIRGELFAEWKPPSPAPADFLWVTEGSIRKKIRLGVLAEKSLAHEKGVVVRKVTEGSSAEKAGIEAGDTIVSLDEETINDMVDLRLALSTKEPGSVSRIVYLRDGAQKETEVTFFTGEVH